MPVRKVYIWITFFASILKYIFSSFKECNVTMYISYFKEFWLFLSLIIVVPIGVLIQNNSVLVLDFLGSPPPSLVLLTLYSQPILIHMCASVSFWCRNDVKSAGFHVCIAVQGAWFGWSVHFRFNLLTLVIALGIIWIIIILDIIAFFNFHIYYC